MVVKITLLKHYTMKKTLVFALMGIVMMALASCGPKESKEFKEKNAKLQAIEAELATADCDALTAIAQEVFDLYVDPTVYADGEKMTDDELVAYRESINALNEKITSKVVELGCIFDAEEAVEEAAEEAAEAIEEVVEEVAE